MMKNVNVTGQYIEIDSIDTLMTKTKYWTCIYIKGQEQSLESEEKSEFLFHSH